MDVQALEDLLAFGVNAAQLVDKVVHGFSLGELGEVVTLISSAKTVIGEAKQALAEYLALSDADRSTVDAAIVADVQGFTDQNVGTYVQVVLEFLVSLSSVLQMLHV